MSYDRQLSLCLFIVFVLFPCAHINEGMRQETTMPIFLSLFYAHYGKIGFQSLGMCANTEIGLR